MQFSESAIYRHFSSKEEIIVMMLKYLKNNIGKILSNLTKTGDVEKDFETFFNKLSLYFKENPYYVVVVFSEGLMDESDKINDDNDRYKQSSRANSPRRTKKGNLYSVGFIERFNDDIISHL